MLFKVNKFNLCGCLNIPFSYVIDYDIVKKFQLSRDFVFQHKS